MNQQSVIEKLKESAIPSLLTGVVAGGIYYLMYNQPGFGNIKIPVGPIELNPMMAVGTVAAIGNLAGETATHFVLPHFQNMGLVGREELIVPPVLSGLGTYLGARFLISENAEFLTTAAIGAGASVGSKYIYGMVNPKSLSY